MLGEVFVERQGDALVRSPFEKKTAKAGVVAAGMRPSDDRLVVEFGSY